MTSNKDKKLKEQIADNLNLTSLKKSQQEKVISGLMNNVFNRINMTILDLFTEEEKKELEKILKTNESGAVLKYLNSKIKDFSSLPEEVALETVKDFKRRRPLGQ